MVEIILLPADQNPVEAVRRDARVYRPGWAVEVVQNIKGFRAGDRLTVLASSEHPQGGVAVERRDGTRATLPVHQCGARLKVFEWHELQLGRGDDVMVTLNGWSSDRKTYLRAGALRTIKGFAPDGRILLDKGTTLPADFAHLTHGYVSTSMAAQGKTVDRVVTIQTAESFGAASMQQAYVCVGRGREECIWLTDDKDDLLDAVLHNAQRVSALDVMTQSPKLGFIEAVQVREAEERAIARIGHDPPQSEASATLRHQLGQVAGVGNRGLTPALRENPEIHLADRLQAAAHLRAEAAKRRQDMEQDFEELKQRQRKVERGFEPEM